MAVLVIGPTNAGKSTLINSGSLMQMGFAPKDGDCKTIFASQVCDYANLPPDSAVHYNLLHYIYTSEVRKSEVERLVAEPILSQLLFKLEDISHAVVIVAPLQELKERARFRVHIENKVEEKEAYDSTYWLRLLGTARLHSLYRKLFDLLHKAGTPYTVIYSSKRVKGKFSRTSRHWVDANLMGFHFDRGQAVSRACT
jgi:hypothetical protein